MPGPDLDAVALAIFGVVFFAMTIRAVFGFGDAVIAMPLLALLTELSVAVPFFAILGVLVSVYIFLRGYREVHFADAGRLILASACGIPVGLFVLTYVDSGPVKLGLALFLIFFAVFQLLRFRTPATNQAPVVQSERFAYLFGWLSGVLGGAYNTSGPPIVVFGVLRNWTPSVFRATLQGYFLPTGLMILIGHALSGLWTPVVLGYAALCSPAVVLGLWFGSFLHDRIPADRFRRLVFVLLIALGLGLAMSVFL